MSNERNRQEVCSYWISIFYKIFWLKINIQKTIMKKLIVFLACSLLTGSIAFAQTSPKLGYLPSAELLQAMPERAKADSDIAKYAKS